MRFMTGKAFIDTNILIYAYSSTDMLKKEKSLNILRSENLTMSTQVLNEFVWVMSRKYLLPIDLLRDVINNISGIAYISLITLSTINNAISLTERYKYSYWDSLIISSALETGCDVLYTEDLQHNQTIKGIKIINPFKR